MQVEVLDDGEPAPGVIVTFAAALSFNPLTGSPEPTASFAGGIGGAEATTNAQGIATAPFLTANGVAGSYLVGADALVAGADVGPVAFSETNTVPPTVVTGGPYTIAQGQSLSLNASGSTDPYGKTLTYSWTINGHTNAATGVNPTLTWNQLEHLGLDVGAGTFPNVISLQVADGVVPPYTVSTSLTINDTPPEPAILNLPLGNLPVGSPLTLTASGTDVSSAEIAAGLDDLFEVGAGTGQTVVAGQQLNFDGKNPVPLPSGLIANAASLTVVVTFQTTSDGVILGYQNQPAGTTPNGYMPALYVGSNGLLYAEIFDGTFRQMVSSTPVNDGQQHTAELIETGTAQSLYLDGTLVGTLSGTPNPLNMTYDRSARATRSATPTPPPAIFPSPARSTRCRSPREVCCPGRSHSRQIATMRSPSHRPPRGPTPSACRPRTFRAARASRRRRSP